MQCYICKKAFLSLETYHVTTCCDRNVCSPCVTSSSHQCCCYNTNPSSSLDSITCLYSHPIVSSKSIHLQHSLIVQVNSALLGSMFQSCVARYSKDGIPAFIPFQAELLSFFRKVGYLSQRFFQYAFCAAAVFFQTNRFHATPKHLTILSSAASFFAVKVQSIFLEMEDSFEFDVIAEWRSRISHLKFEFNRSDDDLDYSDSDGLAFSDSDDDDYTTLNHLLNPESPNFLLRLRRLDVSSPRMSEPFASFCKYLMVNETLMELNIRFSSLSLSEAASFAVFCANNTLKKLCIASDSCLIEEVSLTVLNALSNNLIIETLDLYELIIEKSTVVRPLINNSTLKSIVFPRGCFLDSTIVDGLKNNSF
ncbi:hypothetical protein GEMRC1_013190 [Eukaryota sp. GEM-RC1]